MDLLHTDVPVLDYQQELIYISSVRTQDVVWENCRERWMIRTNGGRELGKSVLAGRLDIDDYNESKDILHINKVLMSIKFAVMPVV